MRVMHGNNIFNGHIYRANTFKFYNNLKATLAKTKQLDKKK